MGENVVNLFEKKPERPPGRPVNKSVVTIRMGQPFSIRIEGNMMFGVKDPILNGTEFSA